MYHLSTEKNVPVVENRNMLLMPVESHYEKRLRNKEKKGYAELVSETLKWVS